MYPHERSLVELYEDRPFAIVGVNGDDPAILAEIEERKKLTWRSFNVEPDGGQPARDYRISMWPTVLLIDDRGVIRIRDISESQLNMAIEALVSEAEARQEKAGS